MGFFSEFKEFAMRGNVVDMAVGVVIGTSFGKIVSSLVADVIMPPIGMLVGGMDFSSLKIDLAPPMEGMEAATINYGNFIQTLVDFTIIGFAIFLVIKGINTLKRRMEKPAAPAAPSAPPADVVLLAEIRDILKSGKK
ncbi:MAG: large-conductance mechanosensitive channel protein MscL [Deltaproteobacteria bacterium]|nr:large-conductance mechanosensitive channel protein MscL [Deltaproteobacteria bacterium]